MKTIIIDGVEYDLTPKALFKKGDWIVYCNEDVDLITGIEDNGYLINEGGYIPFTCQGDMRYWTIQDAKDGDVLVYEGEIFMIKSYALWNKIVYHCCYDGKILHKHSIYDSWRKENFDKVHPATKEQCDTLFAKMKEAGYEWDADKKELKEIEQ